MKKLKRFLAGVVTLAMAMSMMTMTAFAAPTIDFEDEMGEEKLGSITIHKYVKADPYNPDEGFTGEEITGDVAGGKQPLPGVEFTIVQLKDTSYIRSLYSGTETVDELPKTANEIKNKYNLYLDSSSNSYSLEDSNLLPNILATAQTGTTDENGVIKFSDLYLGIYLVVETKSPDAVSAPADPFIISVPMTSNDAWLYDIHVYPKNDTSTSGDVKLCKVGETAGTEGTTPIQGAQFILQKYNKDDDSWTQVIRKPNANFEENAGDLIGDENGVLTTGADGYITVSGLSLGRYRFIEIYAPDGYIADGSTGYTFTVAADGVYWGEYVGDGNQHTYTWFMPDEEHEVAWKNGGSAQGDTVKDATPMIKNGKPDMDKKVAPKGEPVTWDKEAEYSVGDTIPYQITVQVPSILVNCTKDTVFSVIDTPTNLADDVDSIKVMIGSMWDNEVKEEVDTENYTVSEQGNGFKIVFNGEWLHTLFRTDYLSDREITIEYEATLQDTAVTTTAGNPNTAKLEYSNLIVPEYDGDNPNKDKEPGKNVIEDSAIVYTFQIDVEKVDGNNNSLAGVKFELYKQADAGADGALTDEEAAAKGLEPVDGKAYVKVGDELITGEQGKISAEGLGNGDYWLVETETLEGYNLLTAPVKVNLNIQAQTSMTTTNEYTKNEDGTWTLVKTTIDSSKTTFSNNGSGNATIGHATQKVINRKGFTLPSTGGMGTFVFTFVGIAMMAVAVILFITSKKKEAK